MAYNPLKHHRRSIRLKGYDYSQAGLYYVTLCVKDRAHLFGKIINGEMILNDAGMMVEKWYFELENKYPDIKCDVHVVMPDHFHCIIENVGDVRGILDSADVRGNLDSADVRGNPDSADVRGNPDSADVRGILDSADVRANLCVRPNTDDIPDHENSTEHTDIDDHSIMGEHIGSPLHRVIQWFTTMSTNEYIRGVKTLGWPRFNKKLWQRNYWEHIIRNDGSYDRISNYIINNPKNWERDKLK